MNIEFDNPLQSEIDTNPEIMKYLSDPEKPVNEDNPLIKEINHFSKEEFLQLIDIAFKCQRYDDVLLSFEQLYLNHYCTYLSVNERTILEGALKQTVSLKQKKLNKLDHLFEYSQNKINDQEDFDDDQQFLIEAIKTEKGRISLETIEYVMRVNGLIDNYIMKTIAVTSKGIDREAEVFFYRMKGDIQKYLSQVETEEMKEKCLMKADEYFGNAYQKGGQFLPVTNIVYLNTVLSYAKFLLFFMKNKNQAMVISKKLINHEGIKNIHELTVQSDHVIIEIIQEIYDLNDALVNEISNDDDDDNNH